MQLAKPRGFPPRGSIFLDCVNRKSGKFREERLDVLERRIAELGMEPEQYKYYLDLRRYGGCQHAGFGLGFERMVMYLTGVDNIRDVIPHPRTVGNADF